MRDGRALKIGLLAVLFVGGLAAQPGFAKNARGSEHAGGRVAEQPVQRAHRESGEPPKVDITSHAPARNDKIGRQSGSAPPEPTSNSINTAATRGNKPSDIDTRITVQPSQFGRSANPNSERAKNKTTESASARNLYHRRTLQGSARNAIGLSISPRENPGPYGTRPNRLAVSPPAQTQAAPSAATSRPGSIGVPLHPYVPSPHPSVVPPAANRGAVNGTGLAGRMRVRGTRRVRTGGYRIAGSLPLMAVGWPALTSGAVPRSTSRTLAKMPTAALGSRQIGGPKAVAGINGTTINLKR
jgi:hypothetical protein